MNTKINLLPNAAKFKAYKQLLRNLNQKILVAEVAGGLALVGLLLVVNIIFGVLTKRAEGEVARWKREFNNLSLGAEASQKIKYQAKIVGKVMDQRFEYGQAFVAIGKLFPPEVILEKSDFRSEKSFNVIGVTSDDAAVGVIEQIIADINSGRNDFFSKMELKKMNWSSSGWRFEAVVDLKT